MARSYNNPAPGPIGSVFTGAGGQSNNKLYVAANGQSLSKTDYPELAVLYSGQTQELVGNLTETETSSGQFPYFSAYAKMYYDSTSTYTVYAQTLYWNATAQYAIAIWTTTDGSNWRLCDLILGAYPEKVVSIGSSTYVCSTSGIWRTTDGITFTKVYNGAAYDICSNGTTFFIASGTTTNVSTTDFVTFTTRTTPAAAAGCVFFNTRFWITSSSTTLRYSTDLVTWTSSPITTPRTTDSNFIKVVNGIMFVFANSGGNPIFSYNSDPLVNGWVDSAQTYGSHNAISGLIFDSALSQYILTVSRTSSTYGYVFGSLTLSGTQITSSSSTTSSTSDSLATKYGTDCAWHLSPHYSAKSTTWLTGSIEINNSNVFQNPFFSSSSPGYTRGGTTHLGNRWIQKPCGSTGATIYQSTLVEVSGVFRELRTTSGNAFPLTTSTAALAWAEVYEDSTGYCVTIGANSTTYWYASFNTSRTRVGSGSSTTPDASAAFFVSVKNRGIEIHGTQTSVTTRNPYLYTPQSTGAPASSYSYSLRTTSSMVHFFCSDVTGEILITELTATPSSSPTHYLILNGTLTGSFNISLFNTAGSSVSVTTGCKVIKFGSVYYCHNNGVIYSSTDGSIFNQLSLTTSLTSSLTINKEFKQDVALGNWKGSRLFGNVSFVSYGTSSTASAAPNYFNINGSTGYYSMPSSTQVYGYRYVSNANTTTNFFVPNITTTAGQGVYIVAR